MIAFHPIYIHPLPENHRFPMEKYDLLPRQLIHEGIVEKSAFFEPTSIALETILAVHAADYLLRLKNLEITPREQRISGFVHSNQLIERELTIMEGTRKAAEMALKIGLGFNIAGGTHHAFFDRGDAYPIGRRFHYGILFLVGQTRLFHFQCRQVSQVLGNNAQPHFLD